MQKKHSMGLFNVDNNLRLQKIDKELKKLGGEGLKTKQPFAFQFIKKFNNASALKNASQRQLLENRD